MWFRCTPPAYRPRRRARRIPGSSRTSSTPRPSAAHHVVDLRPDRRPDLLPALASTLAHGGRVFTVAEARDIGVGVELNEVGPPPEKHRVPGVQQRAEERISAPALPPPAINDRGCRAWSCVCLSIMRMISNCGRAVR